ncbi:MAG: hypothetical protein GXP55_09275 [Deltaproteobacteria bacterium]|nr:hypothetical protein [Deltaproteobacteria bacterium]
MRLLKLGLWILLAVASALLLRSARLGHSGAALGLAAIAAGALLVLRASPLRRAAKGLREVARQLTDARPHELVPTRLHDHDHLDRRFFDVTTRELFELGFIHLGDLEDRTLTASMTLDRRFGKKLSVCLRAFRHESGAASAVIAQLGPAESAKHLLEFSSSWQDGRELLTNRVGRVGFDSPPYRRTQILPPSASTLELWQVHADALGDSQELDPEVVRIADLDAFIREYNNAIARAALFRAGRGGVRLEELERVAGPERRDVLEQVLNFMRIEGDTVAPEVSESGESSD